VPLTDLCSGEFAKGALRIIGITPVASVFFFLLWRVESNALVCSGGCLKSLVITIADGCMSNPVTLSRPATINAGAGWLVG
jgi:N-methylhydantoinase B/oxoprolinase/acetone carboxylase alpha subunit